MLAYRVSWSQANRVIALFSIHSCCIGIHGKLTAPVRPMSVGPSAHTEIGTSQRTLRAYYITLKRIYFQNLSSGGHLASAWRPAVTPSPPRA